MDTKRLLVAAVTGFVAVLLPCLTIAETIISSHLQAMMYLQKFGYMNETGVGSGALLSEQALIDSVKAFQRFAGLNETGTLDQKTLEMMNTPRCGVKDKIGHGDAARRKKRYALQGSKWRVTNLTYRISKYPNRIKEKALVDKEIAKAFKVWSDVTALNFIPKKSGRVHIDVRFESREHGDGDPFDGPGQTLAHAFFPQYGGDAHFDDEEKWSIDSYYGTNLFQVAAHEFGHSLGLSHSDVKSSLMAPFYRGYTRNFKLDDDDIEAIQALYGPKTTAPKSPEASDERPRQPFPDNGDAPDLCQDSYIDAVTRTEDGKSYVFKGDYYWRMETNGLADGYPRKISDDWGGLPGNLDAALTWSDGKTFFFKGNQYWRFHNKRMDSGYPKDISIGFEGIPSNIDAAFVWSGNGKTYFFKGDKYWRFDSRNEPPVSDRYPRPISNWEGLPNNIDAAFQWENGRMYFFKGKNYYRFNDRTFSIDNGSPPYPRSTAVWWFDCRSMSDLQPKTSGLADGAEKPIYVGSPQSNPKKGEDSSPDDFVENANDLDVEDHQNGGDSKEATYMPQRSRDGNGADSIVPLSIYGSTFLSFLLATALAL